MRKNHFAKLVRYMKNVYHLERCLNKLSDERVNPPYSTGQIILPVLFGFLLRVKSFNELSFMIKNHEFSQLFAQGTKLPQIDAIRDILKVMDIKGLKQINQHKVKTAVENKTFENGTIDGYMVAAIDGTKFFGSNKKSCSECLKNTKDLMNNRVSIMTHLFFIRPLIGVSAALLIAGLLAKAGFLNVGQLSAKAKKMLFSIGLVFVGITVFYMLLKGVLCTGLQYAETDNWVKVVIRSELYITLTQPFHSRFGEKMYLIRNIAGTIGALFIFFGSIKSEISKK